MTLRIGFVYPMSLGHEGGGARWLRVVAERLSTNFRVQIACQEATNAEQSYGHLTRKGVRIRTIQTLPKTKIPSPTGVEELLSLFLENDVVYFTYWAGGLLSLMLALQHLTRTPVIAGLHDSLRSRKFHADADRFEYRVHSYLLGDRGIRMGRNFSAFHVNNNEARELLSAWGAKQIYLIPNGVDTEVFSPGRKDSAFTILFSGKLEYGKGADLLPSITSKLDKLIPDYQLFIAGSGSLSGTIAKLAASSRNVHWLGFVNDIQKWYALSHVLIMPSRDEQFPLSAIESMACGTPVVARGTGGLNDYVVNGSNGYLVQDVDGLVEATTLIYEKWRKVSDYEILASNSVVTAKAYDWRVIIPKLENMFVHMSTARQ